MTDWGGLSTKELDQDTKDAILDILGVRLIAASQTNPLATIEDVLGLGGGGGPGGPAGAGAQLEHASITKTDSDFSTTSTTPVDVTGTTLNFDLPVGQSIVLIATATMQSPSGVGNDAVLGIDIDGAQFFEGADRDDQSSGTEHHRIASVVVPRATISGAHVAKVILKSISGTTAAQLKVSADTPVRLTALWSRAAPTRATVLKAPTIADTTGPHLEPGTAFVPIPGTSIAFTLSQTQDVLFLGEVTAQELGATMLAHFGIRVDGTDHEIGTALTPSGGETDNVSGHFSLPLLPGPHTAELVFRKDVTSAASARVLSNTDAPSRLTVVFEEPIFGIGSLTTVEAVSGAPFFTSATTFTPVPGTTVPIVLDQEQEVLLIAQGTSDLLPPVAPPTHTVFGIRIIDPITPLTTDVPGSEFKWDSVPLVHSPTGSFAGLMAVARIKLPKGTHSAELIARCPPGAPDTARVLAGARLVATFTKPEAFAKSLGFLKKSAIRTSNFGFSGTDEVPLVEITFTLTKTQTVMLRGTSGGVFANVAFGQPAGSLRHIEDPGGADIITDYLLGKSFDSDGGDFVGGAASVSGSILVDLAAGTHKLVLLAHDSTGTMRAPMQVSAFAEEPI